MLSNNSTGGATVGLDLSIKRCVQERKPQLTSRDAVHESGVTGAELKTLWSNVARVVTIATVLMKACAQLNLLMRVCASLVPINVR